MAKTAKDSKRKILKLDLNSSKAEETNLNSSKEIEGTVYYSIEDVETIVQAMLAELSSDPNTSITLEPSDTGVILNCTPETGEDYTVEVDLNTETLADEGEAIGDGEPAME